MKNQELQITANGTYGNTPTTKISLKDGWNKVSINYRSGAAGTVTPKFFPHGSTTSEAVNLPAPIDATSVTANASWDMAGPGRLEFEATGVSGTIDVFVYYLAN